MSNETIDRLARETFGFGVEVEWWINWCKLNSPEQLKNRQSLKPRANIIRHVVLINACHVILNLQNFLCNLLWSCVCIGTLIAALCMKIRFDIKLGELLSAFQFNVTH